jgi:hypothetical protein
MPVLKRSSEIWRGTSKNGKSPKAQNAMGKMSSWNVLLRTSYCHEYIGEGTEGYKELLKPVKELRQIQKK